ncbi:MAG: hypothetical protein CTY18_02870 [Methylomonas sp.]|nr:MAG: hypothetical protein CTY18_02870 [Methylomonas sp.]
MTSCWINDYIGKPWVSGSQGPDAYDCYGLFRHIQREHFGIDVPFVTVDADDIKAVMVSFHEPINFKSWQRQPTRHHGDAIIMRHHKYPSHIGVWIDDFGQQGALHCVHGAGVVFSTVSALMVSGWHHLEFWRHQGTN